MTEIEIVALPVIVGEERRWVFVVRAPQYSRSFPSLCAAEQDAAALKEARLLPVASGGWSLN